MPISWKEEKRRRDNNLCVGCGAELPDTKYKNCEECRRKRRERDRKTREHKKIAYNEQGKCWQCSYPLDEDGKCQRCKAYSISKRKNAKEKGLCRVCMKNKSAEGYVLCDECRKKHNDNANKRYQIIKQKKLCKWCGKKTDGKVCCPDCRKKENNYAKETRIFMLENGICPVCRTNEILDNEKSCPECKAKRIIYYENHKKPLNDEQKKKRLEYRRQRSEELKKKGLCNICGKRKANDGRVTCGYCREKKNESYRLKRQEQPDYMSQDYRRQAGICYQCGKQISITEKSCPDCKKMIAERLLKARGYIVEGENQ